MVTLQDAKAHLGIIADHQDTFIEDLLRAATDACHRFIGTLDRDAEQPAVFDQAVKMTLAAFFEGREGAHLPDDAQALLWDLRPWVFA